MTFTAAPPRAEGSVSVVAVSQIDHVSSAAGILTRPFPNRPQSQTATGARVRVSIGRRAGRWKPRPGPPGSSMRAGGSSSVLRPTRARVDSWLFGYSIVPKWSTFWDTTLLFERHVSGSTPRPEAEQRMLPVLGFCRGVDKTCCVPNASFLGRWNSQRAKSCSRLL
jgi:hypothetical protein